MLSRLVWIVEDSNTHRTICVFQSKEGASKWVEEQNKLFPGHRLVFSAYKVHGTV